MLIVQEVRSAQSYNSRMQVLQNKAALFLHETAWLIAVKSTYTSQERKEFNRSIAVARDIAQQIVSSKNNISNQAVKQLSSKFARSEQTIVALCVKQDLQAARHMSNNKSKRRK